MEAQHALQQGVDGILVQGLKGGKDNIIEHNMFVFMYMYSLKTYVYVSKTGTGRLPPLSPVCFRTSASPPLALVGFAFAPESRAGVRIGVDRVMPTKAALCIALQDIASTREWNKGLHSSHADKESNNQVK